MTGDNSNAGSPLLQTKSLQEQLSQLEDQLHNLRASYRFYDCAIRHMTEPDHIEESEDWHFGLFLHQQYLQQQSDHLMDTLLAIKQRH